MDHSSAKKPKLKIPYYDDGRGEKIYYPVITAEDKIVSEYTGLDTERVQELDFITYLIYFHDGVIYRHLQSEEGREYLKMCWTLEQTEPDRKRLKAKFG